MSKPTGISRSKLLLAAAVAIGLPVASVAYYENTLEGLIVGGPSALLLCVYIFAVKFRHWLLVLYGFALIAFTMPTPEPAFLAERRVRCDQRLKAIGIALDTYPAIYRTYPPPYTTDADGNPDKSWRELILPYFERDAEPHARFDCPRLRERKYPFKGYEATSIAPKTAYVAIVGDHAAWRIGGGRKDRDFLDGLWNTILVVELKGSTIDWNEPRDLSLEEAMSRFGATGIESVGSPHLYANALFGDGRVRPLGAWVSADDFRRMVTIDDGERFSKDLLD